MLPRYQGNTTTEEPQARPRNRNQRQRDGFDFLKWEDLTTDPKTAKILACQLMDDNFSTTKPKAKLVMCKISLEGQIKLYALRLNNPNLGILQEAYGVDENDWTDKKILLFTEEHPITGQHRIAAGIPEEKGTRRK